MRLLSTFGYWLGEWWGIGKPVPLIAVSQLIAYMPARNFVARSPTRLMTAYLAARNLIARL